MPNPFDSVLGSGASSDTPATPAPTPVSTGSSNPFDGVLGGASSSPSSGDSTPAPAQPKNPFDQALGGGSAPKPVTEEKPWYEQAWDWANTPLIDMKRQGAGGVEAGVEDFASGFTSPLSIALTVATFGAGSLLENLGVNVGKMAAPQLLNAAKTVGKLASVGFTAKQLADVATQSPQFTQAIDNGDTQKALEIGTTMLLQGGAALLGGKHAYDSTFGNPAEAAKFTSKDGLEGHYHRMLKEDTEQSQNFNRDFKQAVPDQGTRNALQFYAEAGGDNKTLADWQTRINDADINPKLKKQVLGALDKAQNLSEDEIAHADKLRSWYESDFNEAVGKDILSTEQHKTNYAARARWENEPDEEADVAAARTNLGESNQPDHTKKRIFETTVDGILAGYEPVKNGGRYVMDAADIAADYHRAIGKEVAKREFVEKTLAGRAEDNRPFAVQSGSGQTLEADEQEVPPPLTPRGNPQVSGGAHQYNELRKASAPEKEVVGVDPRAEQIARAYEAMKHNPNDPAVKASYDALTRDVKDQYKFATNKLGIRFEGSDTDPYQNSKQMMQDVADNRRLKYLRTAPDTMPTDHPMAQIDPETGLRYNDMFRAVHDLFGHAAEGFEFGPTGEENAWNMHRRMFSRDAIPALATETRGQNSWNNFGDHLRDAEGNIPKKGEPGFVPQNQRPFAEQKAGLLPREFWERPDDTRMAPEDILQHIKADKNYAILQAENPHNQRISDADNAKLTAQLKEELLNRGYHPIEVEGNTKDVQGQKEHSFFVPDITPQAAADIGRKYGQAGILTREGLRWMDGQSGDYVNPSHNDRLLIGNQARKQQYFTVLDPQGRNIAFHVPLEMEKQVPPTADHGVADMDTTPKGPTITNSLTIPDKVLKKAEVAALKSSGKLDEMLNNGLITEKNGKYRFDTSGYVNNIRSPHTNGYAYGGAPDVLVKGPVAFHPEIADTARAILAPERSKIRDLPGVDTLLKAGSVAKHTLLEGSGFHWVQEGLRGAESGVNPFSLERWDMSNPEHVRLIEAGGLQPGIEGAANAFSEGLKGNGLLEKIPGIGGAIEKSNHALFGPSGFIDRLKLTSALKFADRLKEAYPEMDQMSRYKLAGQMANARFGGLNYLAMGRSKETQDIMRLTLLAPDWIESQIRDTALALAYPKLGGKDLARIALYNFVAARALNAAVNKGDMHMEEPFGVVSPDGKKVYSVRTMPTDIYHAVSDPRNFIMNRFNPIVDVGTEMLTQRDKMGRKRDMGEQLKDLFTQLSPIPAQGLVDKVTGNEKPNASWTDTVASATGVTTRPERTPAEQLALRLNSERAGSGATPSDKLEKHHRITQLEDRLRNGDQAALADMRNMVRGGQLAINDAKTIMKTSQAPKLVASIRSLPMSNTLDVWDVATNKERQQLAPVMARKIAAFRKTEFKKLTPDERGQVNTRLAKVFHDMSQMHQQPE